MRVTVTEIKPSLLYCSNI